jgi:fatty acid desaturase
MAKTDTEIAVPRSTEYEEARRRVEKRRKFRADLVAYVVINAGLVAVWAATGFGYFWPGWVLGGWGVLLLLDAWNTFYRRTVTESDVEEELTRSR